MPNTKTFHMQQNALKSENQLNQEDDEFELTTKAAQFKSELPGKILSLMAKLEDREDAYYQVIIDPVIGWMVKFSFLSSGDKSPIDYAVNLHSVESYFARVENELVTRDNADAELIRMHKVCM